MRRSTLRNLPVGLQRAVLASVVLTSAFAASAQPLAPLEPAAPTEDAGAEFLGDLLRESEAAAPEGAGVAEPVVPLQDGTAGTRSRWRATPHLVAKATYDDNIFIRHRDRTEDYIFALSPGLALGYWEADEERERYLDRQRSASVVEPGPGNLCFFDYTATLLGFARTHSQDAVDHDLLTQGRWRGEKLILGASVHLESKSETNTEVGGRIRRKTLTAALTSSYQATEKTAVGLAFYNRTNDPQDFVQTVESRGEAFVEYAPTPLLRFGLVGGAGVVNVQSGADQIFERLLARASYSLMEKVETEVRGGVEFRQSDGLAGDRTNPIFEVRATWSPAAATQISLEAFRRVETSIERPDQDYTYTGFALRFHRHFRAGWHGILEGGYEVSDYTSTPTETGRTDGYYFIRPSLLYNFAAWGNASVSYEHRANDSTQGVSSFFDNQTSLQISVIY